MEFLTRLFATLLLVGLSSFVAPAPIKDISPLPDALLEPTIPETILSRSTFPEDTFDASTEDIGADAINAGAASTQGDIDDDGLLDDLERLIEILGDHVDHLRGGSDENDTDDEGEVKDNWEGGEGGPPASEEADQADERNSADYTTAGHHDDASDGGIIPIAEPHVVNHIPEPVYQDYDPGFVNITCKGISVCNPVTVIGGNKGDKSSHREKGWKQWGKGKWDRLLEKTARKKAGWRNHWG